MTASQAGDLLQGPAIAKARRDESRRLIVVGELHLLTIPQQLRIGNLHGNHAEEDHFCERATVVEA